MVFSLSTSPVSLMFYVNDIKNFGIFWSCVLSKREGLYYQNTYINGRIKFRRIIFEAKFFHGNFSYILLASVGHNGEPIATTSCSL